MKLTRQDLSRVAWSLVLSLLLALLGFWAVQDSLKVLGDRQTRNRQARSERAEIRNKLARARVDGHELKQRLARYEDLRRRGILGPERRLDWVEEIRRLTRKERLLDLRYELAPQQLLHDGAGSGYAFMSSNMMLQIQLLHEEQLLDFLAELRARVPAYVRVNSCKLERLPDIGSEQGPLLSAECSLDWITLREKK